MLRNPGRLELIVVDRVGRRLLDVLRQVLELARALVSDGVGLVVALEEVQGGEALHLDGIDVDLVRRSVHLGDHHLVVLLVLGAELVPDGRQALAVAAPVYAKVNGRLGKVSVDNSNQDPDRNEH